MTSQVKIETPKVEKTVTVKFNVSSGFCLNSEALRKNDDPTFFPKVQPEYMNVNIGQVVDIPESLYEQIKDSKIKLPNGKQGDLRQLQSLMKGFEVSNPVLACQDEVFVCEKVS